MSEFKVLIVDDSPFMRKVFSDVIDADAAFKVLATASNGKEGVDLALELKPDIITMDLEMPQMNGLEALQRIMNIQPTPVIMLSAVTDNGTRDTIKALQYGAIDFIRKPDGAVKLDIRQVGEQLLEKLHIALETMSSGSLRMLPAVEEKAVIIVQPTPAPPLTLSPIVEDPANKVGKPDKPGIAVDTIPSNIASVKEVQPKENVSKEGATHSRKPEAKTDKPAPRISSVLPVAETGMTKPKSQETRMANESSQRAKPVARVQSDSVVAGKKTSKPAVTSEKASSSLTNAGTTAKPRGSTQFEQLVAIGTSTGGPRALHEVLTGIPAEFPAPILVVQHMPPKFTFSLAQRLDNFCSIHVREAVEGELVETATAYIAPGGKHMSLKKEASGKYRIRLSEEGPRSGHMPSVDVLFESLIGQRQLVRHIVLMTGMGSDGAKGMKALRSDGAATTIAESEQTCVVYGMPRSAVELGAVSHQLPLQGIAPAIVQEVRSRKP
ncbi:protein-glutamate methylesterase/protein-glutamine glutaminase [Cohnella lupini]|uniref:Protein-glutamate methylesterase/protein-glutamine glutaminase n=1 Tax=Cohnella lupini TaxID=1294267 RepID=A0A3D9IWR6_9BACL|nr:chemotaxis response regulator protein-glutamate methylesterase [Cohnella lupini]RED66047.1 two-component system chemotaxis response regulator CheB [Cohnella lupini]